ncbi:MAG: SDR family NAD(P)-dependent oxidoreductase, partial [Rubrivivax sp.]
MSPSSSAASVPTHHPVVQAGSGGAVKPPRVCCVIGAGDATGSAVARRFAREGYAVCVARRTVAALQPLVDSIVAQGGQALAFGLDARREEQVSAFFD